MHSLEVDNSQKVLGQNCTSAPVPWQVLGPMSPLLLWSQHLWT